MLALALILAIGLALNASASSGSLSKSEIDAIVETTTDASAVVSPFTAAVKAVRDSVVLVRNYQVSRSTGISPFGWGFDYGYGFGYGDGYNGGNSGTERLAGKSIRPGHIFLTESGEIDPSVIAELEALIRSLVDVREIHHTRAGCTVSSHCGPKTLGVLFINE